MPDTTQAGAPALMSADDLADLAVAALRSYGLPEDAARTVSRVLVLAELFGLRTHGVARILEYGERLAVGGVAAAPDIRIERPAPSIALVDGANGVGPLVGASALDAAMEGAREQGVGVAFARGSNHFGPVAPYNFIAAEAGFASIIGSNATTTIAPWGGKDARLGNSPVGFGVPNPAGRPIILDMAISVAARAKIRRAAAQGAPIPEGWATDRDGHPTTDAKAALDGFLLPIGGHKGYGLALIVDLFAGLLSGAAYLTHVKSWQDAPDQPQNLGHFFILIDAARLGSTEWLAARMADFAAILHDAPPADPEKPVLLPGEIEMLSYEKGLREGVALDPSVRERLVERAARV